MLTHSLVLHPVIQQTSEDTCKWRVFAPIDMIINLICVYSSYLVYAQAEISLVRQLMVVMIICYGVNIVGLVMCMANEGVMCGVCSAEVVMMLVYIIYQIINAFKGIAVEEYGIAYKLATRTYPVYFLVSFGLMCWGLRNKRGII